MKEDKKIIESIQNIRSELLKQGDLYNGFTASIISVLRKKEQHTEDGGIIINAEHGTAHLAREIMNRLIGEER